VNLRGQAHEGPALGPSRPVAGGIDFDLPGRGVRLRATRWSAPDTPGGSTSVPVLLLHGLASQRRFWNLVVPHLLGGPVVALDQRGHGDAERPAGPYDLSTCAEDVTLALDALGLERAVLVGHSWGGAVATTLAAQHPDRVSAVVAIDGGFTNPLPPGASPEARAEVRRRLEPPRIALPERELVWMFSRGAPAAGSAQQVLDALLPGFALGADGLARARLPFERHMQVLDGMLDLDVEAVLDSVRCPAWLVSCEPLDGAGESAAAWARSKAAGLDRAAGLLAAPRLLRWAGAVHDVPLQWPALVGGLVRTALDEVAANDVAAGEPVDRAGGGGR